MNITVTTHFCTTSNNSEPIFLSQNTPISKDPIDSTPTAAEQRLNCLDSEPLSENRNYLCPDRPKNGYLSSLWLASFFNAGENTNRFNSMTGREIGVWESKASKMAFVIISK